jgi:DNA-directed RNA polymerase specialized sigma subunit
MTTATPVDKKPVEYVNNKALLAEFIKSKERGEMTNELAKMLMLMCERYGRKTQFMMYTYIDDMKSFAMLNLVKSWKGFNPDKSNNPFAYFTTCITNSFLQYLNHEKKHRNIRDLMLVENGLDPSYTFTENYNADNPFNQPLVDEIVKTKDEITESTDEETTPTEQDSAIH